jgi:hypothetical protein
VTCFLTLKDLNFKNLKQSSQLPQSLQSLTTPFLTASLLLRLLRLFEFVVVVVLLVVVVIGDKVWLALHKQIIDWQIEQIIIPSF